MKHPRNYKIGDPIYLAGFADGEGYFGLRKHKRVKTKLGYGWWPDVEVSNREKHMLERLQEEWGCGRVEVIRSSIQEGDVKECYRWFLDPNDLRFILPKITPHLRIKKQLAILLSESLPLIAKGKARSLEDNKRLEAICMECSIINRRGKGHGMVGGVQT